LQPEPEQFHRTVTRLQAQRWRNRGSIPGRTRFISSPKRQGKGKGKVLPITAHEGPGGEEVYLYSFFNLGSRWGGWSTPCPGRFSPGKDPIPIVQEARWASRPVWTGAENLAHTGIRSPDRPDRSETLYRLSYRGSSQRQDRT